TGQVAAGAGAALRLARIDDLADQAEPTPAKAPARDIARRRNPRRQQDLERRGLRQALAVIVQHGTHARREFRHRQREHRAAGGFDREAVHAFEEIDLARLGGTRPNSRRSSTSSVKARSENAASTFCRISAAYSRAGSTSRPAEGGGKRGSEISLTSGTSGVRVPNRRMHGPIPPACNCRSFSGEFLPWVA